MIKERAVRHKAVNGNNNIISWIAGGVAALAVFLLINYFLLPPWNVKSIEFWAMVIAVTFVFVFVRYFTMLARCSRYGYKPKKDSLFLIPVVILLLVVIANVASAVIFHTDAYSSLLKVEDAVFEEDLQESLNTDVIALMDTKSAKMLGGREIGTLSNVVSQFDVSDDYTQIDLNGTPKKVAALNYAGFFKWRNNKKDGIPGYIIVDPVSMSATYKSCDKGMIYVPSAYFGQNAYRKIRFKYPTAMFGNLHFEVDESGQPFYVATVYKKTVIFGGTTVKGAIILNPVDGECEYYDLADIPVWVDDVYDGDLICEQYDLYGMYQNGFINSLFGKKGCKQVTKYRGYAEAEDDAPVSDYGYVSKDGDIWIYTGVTSVNNDSSNIGFLLANERTGEAHYYNIAGADETSAMAAAEGEVQEKGYQASFPSLINIDGNPTYIMVLKDASGLVKLYAAVNVEQYNYVTTAATQKECIAKYRRLMGGEDAEDIKDDTKDDEELEATGEAVISIKDIKYIDIDAKTYIYLIDSEDNIYRAKAGKHEEMLLLKAGDKVSITFAGKEIVSCDKK